MSYDKIDGMTVSVSRSFDMLSKITTGKVEQFACLSIGEVINMDIEVANDDEFMNLQGWWLRGKETMRIG